MDSELSLLEEVQTILSETVEAVMSTTSMMTEYSHTRAQSLMSQVLDATLLKLTQQVHVPRKFVVQCLVVQRNGSGFVSTNTCLWDRSLDVYCTHQHDAKCLTCITTVYAVSL